MSGGGNPITRVVDFVTDTVRDVVVEPVTDVAGTLLSPVTDALKPEVPEQVTTAPVKAAEQQKESEGFQEIPKTVETAELAKKRVKDEGDRSLLDSQRAALGARRRQSLFSTSQSRSLLG